jgi:hypothetical protein
LGRRTPAGDRGGGRIAPDCVRPLEGSKHLDLDQLLNGRIRLYTREMLMDY